VRDLTSDNRVAMLRSLDVQYNASAIPDKVIFDDNIREQPYQADPARWIRSASSPTAALAISPKPATA
jgi:hypothetical protein